MRWEILPELPRNRDCWYCGSHIKGKHRFVAVRSERTDEIVRLAKICTACVAELAERKAAAPEVDDGHD